MILATPMPPRSGLRALFVLALLAMATPAMAHRLSLTVHADKESYTGLAEYLPGGPVANGQVRLRDASGTVIAETTTAADGTFQLPAMAQDGLHIECVTLDGHRAEAAAPPAPGASIAAAGESGAVLTADVEAAVARQVQPVLDRLQSLENATRLRDVLGGIGYIVGFAGLLGWWKSRPRKGG